MDALENELAIPEERPDAIEQKTPATPEGEAD